MHTSLYIGLVALLTWSTSRACPEFCFCFDNTFVTCSNFQILDLAMLPSRTDTLTISSGDIDELPMGFLAMAKRLRFLEISKLRVRVVRQGAFRGLANLDKFSITDSTFDIVEPESFSGMRSIQEFEIISSQFGRVGKHAFSSLSSIRKFTIWLSSFGTLADEAFFRMHDVTSYQIYSSNVTHVGRDIFKGVKGVEEVVVYDNNIDSVSERSFRDLAVTVKKLSVRQNTFVCSCSLSWILTNPEMTDNACVFPGQFFTAKERTFQLRDLTPEILCSAAQPVPHSTEVSPSVSLFPNSSDDVPEVHDDIQTEIEQPSEDIGRSTTEKVSEPQILPVIETFDDDLTFIDQILFEDNISPTLMDNNETMSVSIEESNFELEGVSPEPTRQLHDIISMVGTVHVIENVTQSVIDMSGNHSVELVLVGSAKVVTDNPEQTFETGDTSTEDNSMEASVHIVGEYIEASVTPAYQEVDLSLPSEHDTLPQPKFPDNATTDHAVVTWEQENVYFDQKTQLSSSEHEDDFGSEPSLDEFLDEDSERRENSVTEDSEAGNDSSATKVVVDKLALAVSGRVNEQARHEMHERKDERKKRKPGNSEMSLRASLLGVLASLLFCILHWLALV
ncbi:uncharacterized protein LOC106080012 [Biomphalaria glabrata]|uniref:Uncharacterized protein LOC106080012 n=1 Tax=Biomphalaria glabrata TaxID=6526 RepID=A0A9W2YXY9_BIOGL|nr:uncharacterized protein LOC106080012 [Biomphalaria glabrata]